MKNDMENLERLPRTFMEAVIYQLTIRAWKTEWTVSYEFNSSVFGEIFAHGETLTEAVNEMVFIFENHEAFKYLRHLLVK